MYAIAFDMVITDLRANYGEPYNNAYFEINKVLRQYEFYNTQGSVYLTEKTDMANLFRAIDALKRIPWFQASVRDLRAFRVEDWSNFTDFIKENKIDTIEDSDIIHFSCNSKLVYEILDKIKDKSCFIFNKEFL